MPYYKIKRKWLSLVLLALLSAFLLGITSTALSIYLYGSRSDNIKADAAIVLGAAVWGEEPSPVFRERINHAIDLYKNRDVHTIIFTGGVGESNEPAEGIVGKNYAVAQGVKASDILVETQSRTTYQNLKNAQSVAAAYPLTKFLIVSDPLHMKRSVLMAKDLGMDAYSSPTPTTRYQSFNAQVTFLMRETYFYLVYLALKI
ncbi:YdcF family protein [Fischerella sp. JS2]|uniref:YdcF family protein n=1 Tax=Fischerella sp. JS2 TaxID=2597771 RepID=UPI0028EE2FAD|nr:YdcF family protein [Fischerella sp. JS2]